MGLKGHILEKTGRVMARCHVVASSVLVAGGQGTCLTVFNEIGKPRGVNSTELFQLPHCVILLSTASVQR